MNYLTMNSYLGVCYTLLQNLPNNIDHYLKSFHAATAAMRVAETATIFFIDCGMYSLQVDKR